MLGMTDCDSALCCKENKLIQQMNHQNRQPLFDYNYIMYLIQILSILSFLNFVSSLISLVHFVVVF